MGKTEALLKKSLDFIQAGVIPPLKPTSDNVELRFSTSLRAGITKTFVNLSIAQNEVKFNKKIAC